MLLFFIASGSYSMIYFPVNINNNVRPNAHISDF